MLNQLAALVGAGPHRQHIPRMIIQYRQWCTYLSILHLKRSLEIHLPEIIGSFVFESNKPTALGRVLGVDALVSLQNIVDSTARRNLLALQQTLDLTSSPIRILSTKLDHPCLDDSIGSLWAM